MARRRHGGADCFGADRWETGRRNLSFFRFGFATMPPTSPLSCSTGSMPRRAHAVIVSHDPTVSGHCEPGNVRRT